MPSAGIRAHELTPWLRASTGWSARARSLGWVLLYYLTAFLSVLLISSLLRALSGKTLAEMLRSGVGNALLGHTGLLTALGIIPTIVVLRAGRRPADESGWRWQRVAPNLGAGALMGVLATAVLVAALWLAGALALVPGVIGLGAAVPIAAVWALIWLVQAAHEEAFARGGGFIRAAQAIGFWPAALLSSLAFAGGHLGNAGETPLGLVNAALLGLVLAYSLKQTGSLWFALGFHASWNFVQSTVLGLANSGNDAQDAIWHAALTGSPLLTGGSAGPEGSVLVTVLSLVLALIVRFCGVGRFQGGIPSV